MSYELNYSESGFILQFKGKVTAKELNKANGEIHGHPSFDEHNYQIVHLLDADLSSVTEDDGELPAETDSIASRTRWGVKVALVAKEGHDLSVANGYVAYARELVPKWEFGVFSTYEDALKWAKVNN